MHLHFERSWSSRTDCSVLSLTWMGKVPDELPEEDGWRLNRVNYYQTAGWRPATRAGSWESPSPHVTAARRPSTRSAQTTTCAVTGPR
ncbi:hypothetical protein HPB48_004569 [Haemaphysalis longicornis]|uniref:Uncharacterized protein n=1 Tax=Haemaphysalis longicornis TaxID=44386 RepID=A0A9J6H2Y0_HAELO|nr:hypothetical protein HPB48_004569 [Haemaphysalis longicornis]